MASSRAFTRPLRFIRPCSTPILCRPYIRTITSTANAQAAVSNESSKTPKKLKPLTQEQRNYLDSALRVNQAGELAAVLIYAAQSPILVRSKPHLRKLMTHMYDQEDGHFKTFNGLIHKHRVRPTAMYPLWSVMATGLGWSTAMMGYEAAMACTEAVETEIGGHYNEQIRTLLEMVTQWEAEGYEVGEELSNLVKTLRVIRDEELEHLDHAVEHDAQKAEPHWLLTGVIRAGCRGAIWVSERVISGHKELRVLELKMIVSIEYLHF
ncbi:ubiquinone biosynthesis monooxygenase coq7 [Fusarium longipes]|uniref:5-demethoxyubiquinone hydroxylase, mitochondrial n=1 Tax=Fusarium longipes TaxID=694270 RepID=A0A395RH09_9HYPO|nr:ubiquinone biosynthesis monooxygenase coq7 [Fusarium longipes]